MAIYYYVPQSDKPSWGAGMIYYHVWLLRKNNIDAHILHDKKPYKLTWIKLDISVCYIDNHIRLAKDDYLVIPEFYADHYQLLKFACRKIVFVQNAFYIFDGLKSGKSYEDLGIEQVFYYMPHLEKILKQITKLPLFETPPFVAPYFYTSENDVRRKRRIILYPKFDNRDYNILKRMLEDKLELKEKNGFQKLFSKKSEWEIIELKNKNHWEVAEEMKQAAFFVSLNTTEAFNSSVPEAMAAGCINVCYEGVGPADFLEDNINAFVFANNHIFPLTQKLIDLTELYDRIFDKLDLIRMNAAETANKYKIENLEKCLVHFFKQSREKLTSNQYKSF